MTKDILCHFTTAIKKPFILQSKISEEGKRTANKNLFIFQVEKK